ncbi:AAA family ATPase [bacterium]|nr:AAA family ATPase [bacterium]
MDQERILHFLSTEQSYLHDVAEIRHVETHISHVFLTGSWVYKLKKPLRLDFCDFTTCEQRKHFCEREITLNSRYAPELYDTVVPICEEHSSLNLAGRGTPVEYLVRMRQFDTEMLFLTMLEHESLTREHIIQAVESIVSFHHQAQNRSDRWSVPEIEKLLHDNFTTISECTSKGIDRPRLEEVQRSTVTKLQSYSELIEARRGTHVKEVHGDLHLKNICIFEGRATLFDGIEFGDRYSCCDTWADFAFLYMDLLARKRPDLAYAALNSYAALSGDFEGLSLLGLYVAYRATVRAKVACIQAENNSQPRQQELVEEANRYLSLTSHELTRKPRFFIAVGGISGSGKSTIAQNLSEQFGAVHLKTDAIRKHLAGVPLKSHLSEDYYSPEWSERTYNELLRVASLAAQAGYSVVVDGAHLTEERRDQVESLSRSLHIPFLGLWCEISAETAIARVEQRTHDVSDADTSVVKNQLSKDFGELSWQVLHTEGTLENTTEAARRNVSTFLHTLS